MKESVFFYSGLVNAINYNPNLTPEDLVKTHDGFPAIRVHNKDWRPEFNGLIPGVVSFVEPQELKARIKFLRNKFCTHAIKVLSKEKPHNALIFSGTFIDLPIKDIASVWQKTALKTYLSRGGLGHAPFVDCVLFRIKGMLKLYALCPVNSDENLWKDSCREIAGITGLLNPGFIPVNMHLED